MTSHFQCCLSISPLLPFVSLSWADTAASTFGRLYGRRTPKLPSRILGLPLAPRKSTAGFVAASLTGALIAVGFWGVLASTRFGGRDATWTWEGGVNNAGGGGPLGLAVIGLVAGLVSGIAEALGAFTLRRINHLHHHSSSLMLAFLDLGSLDDNFTLPIISGSCLFGFFKLWEFGVSLFSS